MILLRKEWKLALAALFLLSAAGLALAVKWQGVQLDRAKLTIDQRDATVKELQQAVVDRDLALDHLRPLLAEQAAEVGRLRQEGAMLEDELRMVEKRLLKERASWIEREAELSKPLPSGCEEKVRESVRRVQAALRGIGL